VDERQILLFRFPGRPQGTKLPRGFPILGQERQAAGFPVEAIDEMQRDALSESKPQPSCQAGEGAAFCGVARQPGRLVERQQTLVFVNDVEQIHWNRRSPREVSAFLPAKPLGGSLVNLSEGAMILFR